MSSRFGLKAGNYKGEVKDWWSHDKIGPVCGCRPCLNRCQVVGFLVGERGFEPPAPASRRRISPPHMAVFRDITGGFPRISLRLFPLDSRFRGSKGRSEEHTSELQSLMRISYADFCLQKKNNKQYTYTQLYNNLLLKYNHIV